MEFIFGNSLVGRLNADIICQIPLGLNSCSDRQIWTSTATVNGEFIVRSAYHIQMDMIALAKGECLRMCQHCLLWKSLWKMKVPHTNGHS
jgi:hypothetical protein